VTSLVIKPTELQVGTVSDRRVRTIGVDANGHYAVLATAPQTHPTFGGFYLSQIQDQDPAVLLRGLAVTIDFPTRQVGYIVAEDGPGPNVMWMAYQVGDWGHVEVINGKVYDYRPCTPGGASAVTPLSIIINRQPAPAPAPTPTLVVPTKAPPASSALAAQVRNDPVLIKPSDPRSLFLGDHFADVLGIVRRHLGAGALVRELLLQTGYAQLLVVRHGWETAASVTYAGKFALDSATSTHTGPLASFSLAAIALNSLAVITRRIAANAHVPATRLYTMSIEPQPVGPPLMWTLTATNLESFRTTGPGAPIDQFGPHVSFREYR
jgi:hypothetical protein